MLIRALALLLSLLAAPAFAQVTPGTSPLSIAKGGTSAANKTSAFDALAPAPTRPGDISYWNGTHYVNVPGNNLGTNCLQENSSGVVSFGSCGGGGSGVSSLNGQTGAIVSYFAPQHRITLTSGTPVMATSVAGQSLFYVTPYAGNMMPIFDGTNMVPTPWPEVSQTNSDATKSPAAVATSKVYDIFCWIDTGPTNRCTRGPAWTNSTTRGYTLTYQNGILLNTSTITNGPAALRGTWVGTIASNVSSSLDWICGAAGSGGVAAVFNVWNAYNRVTVGTAVTDNSAGYTYTSNVVRQAHASAGMQISFVMGAAEDAAATTYGDLVTGTAVAGTFVKIGIGLDSTTAYSVNGFYTQQAVATYSGTLTPSTVWNSGIGTHFIAALQSSDNSNANTFNAGSNGTLSATLRM